MRVMLGKLAEYLVLEPHAGQVAPPKFEYGRSDER
jgi:hypothetical protein